MRMFVMCVVGGLVRSAMFVAGVIMVVMALRVGMVMVIVLVMVFVLQMHVKFSSFDPRPGLPGNMKVILVQAQFAQLLLDSMEVGAQVN